MTRQEYDDLTDEQRFDLISELEDKVYRALQLLNGANFIRPKFDFEEPHEVKYDKNKHDET